jgi:hypothetical protein
MYDSFLLKVNLIVIIMPEYRLRIPNQEKIVAGDEPEKDMHTLLFIYAKCFCVLN